MPVPDRRQHCRYPRQLRVSCKNRQLVFDSLTQDICGGGMFIITDNLLPLNSPIDLEISSGMDEAVIHCQGRIAWINVGQVETYPPGFGVEFLEMEEQIMGRLLQDWGDFQGD